MTPRTASVPDVAAAGLALLLPLAFSTAVTAPTWSPRAGLLLAIALPGVVGLFLLLRTPARAIAIAALAWVAVAAVSTALSDNPHLAFFGEYNRGVGWLFVASIAGCYAIGRLVSEAGARRTETLLGVAIVVNAVIALVQHRVDLRAYDLGVQDGRSTALLGNPVHVSTLMASGAAMAAFKATRTSWWWLAVVALATASVQAAGSRLALIALVLGALVLVAIHRNVRSAIVVVVGVAGIALGTLATSTGSVPGTERLAGGVLESSTNGRFLTWQSAAEATADRPVFGNGPGRYLTAVEPHRPQALVEIGGDAVFEDAHNIVVEYAVTTGLAGVAALAAFVLLALRRTGGALLWFAAAAGLMFLAQPLHSATLPLGFLALGAAAPRLEPLAPSRWARAATAVVGIVATAGGALLVAGDARLLEAQLDYDPVAFEEASDALPRWPQLQRGEARMWVFYAEERDDPRLYDRAVAVHRREVANDPADARTWVDLGSILLKTDDIDGASNAFEEALERSPNLLGPRLGLARVALERDDPERADELVKQAVALRGFETRDMRELRIAIDAAIAGET